MERPHPVIVAAALAPAFWFLAKFQYLLFGTNTLVLHVTAPGPGGHAGLMALALATLVSLGVLLWSPVSAIRSKASGEESSVVARQAGFVLAMWVVAATLPAAPL